MKKSIHNIGFHVVWIPKYRAKILTGNFKTLIKKYLIEKALDLGVILEKCEIMPDHIHLFIRCKPIHSIANVVGQLKGYSAYKLRQHYSQYKDKYKHLWAPGYFCESVGHISEETIKKYIDNQ